MYKKLVLILGVVVVVASCVLMISSDDNKINVRPQYEPNIKVDTEANTRADTTIVQMDSIK